eukprot:5771-Heterococcus_DN1.PRE.2
MCHDVRQCTTCFYKLPATFTANVHFCIVYSQILLLLPLTAVYVQACAQYTKTTADVGDCFAVVTAVAVAVAHTFYCCDALLSLQLILTHTLQCHACTNLMHAHVVGTLKRRRKSKLSFQASSKPHDAVWYRISQTAVDLRYALGTNSMRERQVYYQRAHYKRRTHTKCTHMSPISTTTICA